MKRERHNKMLQSEKENEHQRKNDYEKMMANKHDQIQKDMRSSQMHMSMNRGSVRMDGKDMPLVDINMQQLTKDSQRDIRKISQLEQAVENLTGKMTSLNNVSDIDNQFSMRPTLLSDNS